MIATVRQTLRRHAMIRPGDRVGAAVSGGADSVGLVLALNRLAPEFDLAIGIIHVNHGLRGEESDQDEAFVRSLAERLGRPIQVLRCSELAGNLEAAARAARYAFFEQLIADQRYDCVATGHTLSDQAETVLFRLLRGAGTAGLAGVRPKREPGIIRPLIKLEGNEIREWLRAEDEVWREDLSNVERRFARNRVRHELLPLLRSDWNPRVDIALARHAARAAEDEDYWAVIVDEEIERLTVQRSTSAVVIDCERAGRVHAAVLTRALRRLALDLAGSPDHFGAGRVDDLIELIFDAAGHRGLDLPGLRAQRSFRWLRLETSTARVFPAAPASQLLEPPTTAAAPDRATTLTLRLPGARVYNEAGPNSVDWERVPKPLRLRRWHSGDALKRNADQAPTMLRELFQAHRVASWDRPEWPVIAGGVEGAEQVVWTRGFGVSADFTSTGSTVADLEVREITAEGREIRRIEDWLAGVYKG